MVGPRCNWMSLRWLRVLQRDLEGLNEFGRGGGTVLKETMTYGSLLSGVFRWG